MGVCNCSMFCCTLLYAHSRFAIILMRKRELVDDFKKNEIKKLFVVNSTEHELYQCIMLNVNMSTIVIIVTFISIINIT